jgi:hypothetical protein
VDSTGERHAVVVSAEAEGDGVPGEAERERGCSLATCDQVFFSRLVPVDDVVASTSNPVSCLFPCFSSDGAPEKDQPCFGVELCDNGEDGVEFPLWLLETSNFPASPAPPTLRFLRFPLSRAILMVRFSLVCGDSPEALSSTGLAGDLDVVEVGSSSYGLFLSSVLLGLSITLAGYFSARASSVLLCSFTALCTSHK